jgi:hypothetical protein
VLAYGRAVEPNTVEAPHRLTTALRLQPQQPFYEREDGCVVLRADYVDHSGQSSEDTREPWRRPLPPPPDPYRDSPQYAVDVRPFENETDAPAEASGQSSTEAIDAILPETALPTS